MCASVSSHCASVFPVATSATPASFVSPPPRPPGLPAFGALRDPPLLLIFKAREWGLGPLHRGRAEPFTRLTPLATFWQTPNQRSPAFLAQGTDFMEENFSIDGGGGGGRGRARCRGGDRRRSSGGNQKLG